MKALNMKTTVRCLTVAAAITIATPMTATERDQAAAQTIPSASVAIEAAQAAEQARAVGLTDAEAVVLQEWVEEQIADPQLPTFGGIQITANKILWADGSAATTIPLPGETRARNLGTAATGPYGCPYYRFCIFGGTNYTGTMIEYFYCREYPILIGAYLSYENNQTKGTRARVLNVVDYPYGGRWIPTPGAYSRNPYSTHLGNSIRVRPC